MYVGGVLGDSYNPRIVLTIAFAILSVFFMLQSFAGIFNITSHAYFYFVAIVIGAANSVLPPTLIAIMGNWFPKKNRGLIVGFWATCNNFGNIIGIQLAAGLMNVFGDHWEYLMVTVSILTGITTLVIFFFLVPEPHLVGITIDEYSEKEAMIDTVVVDQTAQRIVEEANPEEVA